MKKLLLFLITLPFLGQAQQTMNSCCKAPANQSFSELAMSKKFMESHAEPLPMENPKFDGSDMNFQTKDTIEGHGYIVRSKSGGDKWLLIFHEWWGLNDYIKKEADRFATEMPDVNVLAIDLYDRKVTSSATEAQKYSSGITEERARTIIRGAINQIGTSAKIQTIGWCFGGGWSLQTALMANENTVGCVVYYGMPELNKDKLNDLKCDLIGIYGTNDQFITTDLVSKFDEVLSALNKNHEFSNYPAVHAFANPSNPKYDKSSADDARKKVLDFLKNHFEKN